MDTLYWHSVFTRRTYIKLVVRWSPALVARRGGALYYPECEGPSVETSALPF